jgi:hypothetical protein
MDANTSFIGEQFNRLPATRQRVSPDTAPCYPPGNGSGFCKLHFQQVNQVQSDWT